MTTINKEIIVPVKFDNETIKDVQEAPDFHEFCLKFACEACPFIRMEDCENTFDAIKGEREMKTGYYIRFVPSFSEFAFYFYDGVGLFVLIQPHYLMLDETFENYAKMIRVGADIEWQASLQKEPCELFGFEFVCDEELNYEHSKETK